MQTVRTVLVTIGLTLAAGCGQVSAPPDQAGPPTSITTATSLEPASAGPATTATTATAGTAATAATTAATKPAPTTTRPVATTVRPTTTTTRPLTRAEATSRLCKAVEAADAAIQAGNVVGGGLKLSAGIGAYEKTADPAVVTGARSMLRAGLDGDPEAYGDARRATSTACTRAGTPINLGGGIQCITTPCP
jgi:hypothetical protein